MERKKETLLELKMRYTPLARLVAAIGILIFLLVRWLVETIIAFFQG